MPLGVEPIFATAGLFKAGKQRFISPRAQFQNDLWFFNGRLSTPQTFLQLSGQKLNSAPDGQVRGMPYGEKMPDFAVIKNPDRFRAIGIVKQKFYWAASWPRISPFGFV